MNEPDVRNMCARILSGTGPPLPDSATVLAAGRRALRRRRLIRYAAAGAGTLVMIGAGTIAVAALSRNAGPPLVGPPGTASGHAGATGTTGPPAPSGTATPTTQATPGTGQASAPAGGAGAATGPAGAQQAYAQRMLAALIAAVPDGFTTPAAPVVTAGGTRYQVQGTQVTRDAPASSSGEAGWYITASTDVYRDGAVAAISVTAVTSDAATADAAAGPGATANPGATVTAGPDLCRLSVPHQGAEDGCQVLTATGGAAVRLAWRDIAGYGRIWYASTLYPGWIVTVQQAPGGMTPDRPGYGQAVFTQARFVDLVTSLAFRPNL